MTTLRRRARAGSAAVAFALTLYLEEDVEMEAKDAQQHTRETLIKTNDPFAFVFIYIFHLRSEERRKKGRKMRAAGKLRREKKFFLIERRN
jgi:hypothetical protein